MSCKLTLCFLQAFGNFAGAGYDPPDFVTVQPIPYMDEVQRKPVKDYLGYSIFTTLCCCLPIGMAALVQSVIVSLTKLCFCIFTLLF